MAACCAAAGLALTTIAVLYLLPAVEDTTLDFDTPHLGVQLRIIK